MNMQEKLDRGRVAMDYQSVIEEKIKLIEQEFVEAIKKTAHLDDKGRRNMVTALQICEKVLEYLKSDVKDAKYAKTTLEVVAKVDKTAIDQVRNYIP